MNYNEMTEKQIKIKKILDAAFWLNVAWVVIFTLVLENSIYVFAVGISIEIILRITHKVCKIPYRIKKTHEKVMDELEEMEDM